jgi:transcriptional regulator with XRE-family HTH domain
MNIAVEVGKRIRLAREAMGISQENFAIKNCIARTYYGRVERGEQAVSIKVLFTIAKGLDIEVGDLFPGIKNIS